MVDDRVVTDDGFNGTVYSLAHGYVYFITPQGQCVRYRWDQVTLCAEKPQAQYAIVRGFKQSSDGDGAVLPRHGDTALVQGTAEFFKSRELAVAAAHGHPGEQVYIFKVEAVLYTHMEEF